jgi:hypothetical protein
MREIPGAMMKGRDRSILYPTQPSAQKIDRLDTDLCRLAIEFWQCRVQVSGCSIPCSKFKRALNQPSIQAVHD